MYFPKTIEELEQVRAECLRLVNKRSLLSGAAAVVPLPGADISADIAIMTELLLEINKRFGLSEEQIGQLDLERKKVLLVIISSIGNEVAGKTVSVTLVRSLLKRISNKIAARQVSRLVPVAGQAVSAGLVLLPCAIWQASCGAMLSDYTAIYEQLDVRNVDDVIDI